MDAVSLYNELQQDQQLTLEDKIEKCREWLRANEEKKNSNKHSEYLMIEHLAEESREKAREKAQAQARISQVEAQAQARISQAEAQAQARISQAEAQAQARISQAEEEASREKARLSQAQARLSQAQARISQAEAQAQARISQAEEEAKAYFLEQVKDKFPSLHDYTASGVHFSEDHDEAKVEEKDVSRAISSINNKKLMDAKFWKAGFIPKGGNCDSESDARHLVVMLLNAVLQGLQLKDCVEIGQKRTLAGVEFDIILRYKPNHLPFAALEVKKPGDPKAVFEGIADEGGNRVAGQVFNQLKAIQLFGFPSVVGMVTTGNQWRIMGLPVSDGDPLEADRMIKEFGRFRLNDGKKDDSNVSVEAASPAERELIVPELNVENEKTEEVERELWAGAIVPSHVEKSREELRQEVKKSGEEIVSQLVLFVTKACSILSNFLKNENPGIETIKTGGKMPCRMLDFKSPDQFAFGTITLEKLNLDVCIGPHVENVRVIHHIGTGGFGNVCLATTEGGRSCCAIKFYHNESHREEIAEVEHENWKNIYGKVFKHFPILLKGKHCLVMPYLHAIPEEDRLELLNDGSIKETLSEFAESGYIHYEVKWRHFRRWKEKEKILLIDLGGNSLEERGKEDRDRWIEESIDKLMKKTSKECSTPPAKKLRSNRSRNK